MLRVGKSQVNSYTTRNFVLGVLTVILGVFSGLFFHKFSNELHFTNVAKRSETSLLGSFRIGH